MIIVMPEFPFNYLTQTLPNNFHTVTALQKATSSRWGWNAFCQSRDVAFWKGASGSCRMVSTDFTCLVKGIPTIPLVKVKKICYSTDND
jgi:hypothetical protein